MNYNQATLHAATGKILMLPGWHGYFYWNYSTKELNFRDGDYHLDSKQLQDMNIRDRNDWYYIT
jgi:hypothetical protein|nr:MAG TPA: hypothetical protein [Bacteriophage sp.]DAJ71615.1 MAG TPA: hypothetical protein [Caudoviricetes sp.]DAN75022.1 MAG TPA: hypothetical protein [Caudoviricetes sp.]